MKENRYDDEIFFEKYAQMNRSKFGLEAAGEWATLRPMLPDFRGKRVLDLGCGYGWHCEYAAENGAASVTGVDISEKMLAVARARTRHANARYIRAAIEDADFQPESFDVVISSLALHYIEDFAAVVRAVRRFLAPHGVFVFSAEHPVFTAQGAQQWHYNADGSIAHFPVDGYYYEGRRDALFLGEHVVKYHRTLDTYINALLANGFELTGFAEPRPTERMLAEISEMRDEMRRPMMFIVSAVKR